MRWVHADVLHASVDKAMAGRGVTTPDDALYEEEVHTLIDHQPVMDTDILLDQIRKLIELSARDYDDNSRTADVRMTACGQMISLYRVLQMLTDM